MAVSGACYDVARVENKVWRLGLGYKPGPSIDAPLKLLSMRAVVLNCGLIASLVGDIEVWSIGQARGGCDEEGPRAIHVGHTRNSREASLQQNSSTERPRRY